MLVNTPVPTCDGWRSTLGVWERGPSRIPSGQGSPSEDKTRSPTSAAANPRCRGTDVFSRPILPLVLATCPLSSLSLQTGMRRMPGCTQASPWSCEHRQQTWLVKNDDLQEQDLRRRGGNGCPMCYAIGVRARCRGRSSKSGCLSCPVSRVEARDEGFCDIFCSCISTFSPSQS